MIIYINKIEFVLCGDRVCFNVLAMPVSLTRADPEIFVGGEGV